MSRPPFRLASAVKPEVDFVFGAVRFGLFFAMSLHFLSVVSVLVAMF
jgi:hypothetical protein